MPMSTLFFWKFRLSIRTCNKELIWSTNYPYVHIIAFRKHWSFIWGCFFPVSILETYSAAIISSDFNTNVSCSMRAALLFCMHIKTTRNKAQLIKKTTWVVKLLHRWSACKCNDMKTWFSVLCRHIPARF